jgi:nitrite reductase/ring-hydroxylating ferredoxin subunit
LRAVAKLWLPGLPVNRIEIDAGPLDSLPDPGAREFPLPANATAFTAFVVRVDGQLRAYVNLCPHARRPLNFVPHRFLDRDNREILCTGHGARFAVDDGSCTAGPCPGQSLTPLGVRVENGSILVTW